MHETEEQRRAGREGDERRIAAELVGEDIGTDPFVAAVRATRMPMIVTDPRLPDNPVVFANDAFCRLTGYARDEVLGCNCRFLQGPDSDPDTIRRIHDAVARREAIEIEILNYRKDGSRFWNRLLLAPVPNIHGEIAYFFASQLDVTPERERMAGLESSNAKLVAELARRLAERRESENDLRFTLASTGLGAWTLDLDGLALTCSAACRAAFGRGEEEPFGFEQFLAAVHPDSRDAVRTAIRQGHREGESFEIDYRVATPDSALRWVGMRGRTIADEAGRPIRVTGIVNDLSRPKRLERMRIATLGFVDRLRDLDDPDDIALAASQAVAAALDVDRVGYAVFDAATGMLAVEQEWLAQGVKPVTRHHRFRDYVDYVDDLMRGETVAMTDVRLDPRTASRAGLLEQVGARAMVNVPILENGVLVALFFLNHGRPRRWEEDELGFLRDMAERTRVAVERRHAERRVAAFAASLEQQVADRTDALMQAEAALRQSQKMEAIGQLTGGVAHDFNNLLTVVRSSVDLLRRPDLKPDRRERYLGAISETVDRAAKLTGQLLAFARRQALKPEPFDVARAVDAVADIVRTLAGSRIEVAIALDDGPCFAIADAAQFDTAIVNMAANARDAMEGEGRLSISIRAVDGVPARRRHPALYGRFIAVAISDTGPGINADVVPRIFEPFFTTKGVGRGTGLGLSQVFGFAKQSGGEVRVESGVGEGATFILYLPQTEPPEEHAGSAIDMDDGDRTVRDLSVLVVEDNEPVGLTTQRALEERGYVAALASDAEAALRMLGDDGDGFDIVFSDVMMPGMDGIDLAREIGRRHPALPVVLTSGFSEVLAEGGCAEFALVQKPYTIDAVDAALRRKVSGGD